MDQATPINIYLDFTNSAIAQNTWITYAGKALEKRSFTETAIVISLVIGGYIVGRWFYQGTENEQFLLNKKDVALGLTAFF